MEIKDIHALLEECDDTEDLAWDGWEGGAKFTVADVGKEEVDMKWCFQSTVVQEIATGQYYEITTSRTNGGYWGDSESGATVIRQVKAKLKMVEIVEWVSV